MKFLYNAPAIIHKGALIVGDTHFGMENKLRKKGIFDEQFSMRLFYKLEELIKKNKIKKLIFLGDVKEEIQFMDQQVAGILERLSKLCEIIIVRGNHDGGIEKINNSKIKVAPAEGIVYEKLALVHGHSWPSEELMKCKYLVAAHQHPCVMITDAFGKKHLESVWLILNADDKKLSEKYKSANKKIKLILMPAFNPLVGSAVNLEKNAMLGPLVNNKLFKLDHALVFQLNGTCLGNLRRLV
ncbi:metallophosphoesterase family protein [Candidatus Micrarchaeota archaeon]|nr:metallophosphoesterase family protein [Candidatus Micrarchaeota archaeon]